MLVESAPRIPAIMVRQPGAPRFALHHATPGRYDLLRAAAKVGSKTVRETADTLLTHFQDAPLPATVGDRIPNLAADVADLLEAWADNSAVYLDNPTDTLALSMIRWAGRKLATLGAIPAELIDPQPSR